MTIEKFLNNKNIKANKIPSKKLSKVLKLYKNVEQIIFWYDDEDEDNKDFNNWIDIEGMDYGWIFINHTKKETKKIIIKWSTLGIKKDIYTMYDNNTGIKYYWYEGEDCIIQIRASNNDLRIF